MVGAAGEKQSAEGGTKIKQGPPQRREGKREEAFRRQCSMEERHVRSKERRIEMVGAIVAVGGDFLVSGTRWEGREEGRSICDNKRQDKATAERLTVDGASRFAALRSRFPPPVWYLISASIIITCGKRALASQPNRIMASKCTQPARGGGGGDQVGVLGSMEANLGGIELAAIGGG